MTSSRAGSLPQWIMVVHKYLAHHITTVGAGLLAKAVLQSTSVLNVMASSRASPLPQWVMCVVGKPSVRQSGSLRVSAGLSVSAPACRQRTPPGFYRSEEHTSE